MPHKILVVDDDNALREMVGIVLESEGFEVAFHDAGSDALDAFQKAAPDLVLLDVMLPGKDGIEVCREIRAVAGTPIIMLTAKTESEDVVRGLEAGADDYVVKPFDVQELLARMGAVLRRTQGVAINWIEVGDLALDLQGRRAHINKQDIDLTAKEWAVLEKLASRPGSIVNKEALDQALYSFDDEVGSNTLEVYISRIRKKIGKQRVETVRGLGYRLVEEKKS